MRKCILKCLVVSSHLHSEEMFTNRFWRVPIDMNTPQEDRIRKSRRLDKTLETWHSIDSRREGIGRTEAF